MLSAIFAAFFAAAQAATAVPQPAPVPDALTAGWKGKPTCERLFEDDEKRILRCAFPPGIGHEPHVHPPHFGYAISGGTMRVTDASGTRDSVLATGSTYSRDVEYRHEVVNVGDTTVAYVIVESKARRSPAAESSGVASLKAIDLAWAECYAKNDVTKAREIFSPDLVVTSAAGDEKDMETELKDVAPYPGLKVNYFRTVDAKARQYGDTGVVTGRLEWETESGGRVNALRRRYTATYVRGGSLGWRMVALHLGPSR